MYSLAEQDLVKYQKALRFPLDLEREFRIDFSQRSASAQREFFTLGMFLYLAFAILDYWALPLTYRYAWGLRLVGELFLVAGIFGTRTSYYRRFISFYGPIWGLFVVLYIVLGVLVLIATVYGLKGERIIITPNGIEYHVPLTFAIEVGWGGTEAIRYYWFREGLWVERSSINVKYTNRNTYATFMGFGQSAFIPLSSFSENWRDSELGQQIKQ